MDSREFPEALLDSIHRAIVSTRLKKFDAESLSSLGIPRLQLVDDAKSEVENLYGYIEHGVFNSGRNSWDDAKHFFGGA